MYYLVKHNGINILPCAFVRGKEKEKEKRGERETYVDTKYGYGLI